MRFNPNDSLLAGGQILDTELIVFFGAVILWMLLALLIDLFQRRELRSRPKTTESSSELAKDCARCRIPLRGRKLSVEQISTGKPKRAWRVCFVCGFEELVAVTEPWTLSQRQGIERKKRIAVEREQVSAYEKQLWELLERHEQRQRSSLSGLLALTPKGFEEAVGHILEGNGYEDVEVSGGPGDLDVDIRCISPKGRSMAVQCKRYKDKPIGSRELQTFIGMIHRHHKAGGAMFVTTSRFTKPAEELARKHRIELIDGDGLARLASGLVPDGEDEGPQIEEIQRKMKSLEAWTVIQKERAEEREIVLRSIAREEQRVRAARRAAARAYRNTRVR